MTVPEIIAAFEQLSAEEKQQIRAALASPEAPTHAHPPVQRADFEQAMKTADHLLSKHAELLRGSEQGTR